jgi:PAS domain S-box-containing protein
VSAEEKTMLARGAELENLPEQWLVLEATAGAIFVVDHNGNCTFCNPACLRLLGYPPHQDLLGKNVHRVIHPNCGEEECRIHKSFRESKSVHVDDSVLCRADGTPFRAEIWSKPLRKRDELIGWVVSFIDISQRIAAAEALRNSEAKYRSLVNNMMGFIWTVSEPGDLCFITENVQEIWGYSVEELRLRGKEIWPPNIHPDDRDKVLQAFCALFREGRTYNIEYRFQRKDGQWIWVHSSAFHTYEKNGHHWPDGICTDITALRLREGKLRQSHKMEAIGRLAGGVAHDFNNLLTVIMGNAQVLADSVGLGEVQKKCVQQIAKASEQASSLTRQLLAFSRMQALHPRTIDLNDVVRDFGKMLPRLIGEHVEYVFVPEKQLQNIKADPGQIEQVLLNLAVNARDAMPDGGKLIIETRNAEITDDYASKRPSVTAGDYVVLAVTDTGLGMDAETQSRIFEPFFTTKVKGKGTGLGLATVYGIVKQSGGWIWVYSEPKHGTTFKVYLPRVDEPVEPHRTENLSQQPEGGSETVLLVEDQDDLRNLVADFLRVSGYQVLEASNGVEALRVVETQKGVIDLLVTDVVMPKMGGWELADRAAIHRPEMKVIYVSGFSEYGAAFENVQQVRDFFLQKPFSMKVLGRRVREVLDGKQK